MRMNLKLLLHFLVAPFLILMVGTIFYSSGIGVIDDTYLRVGTLCLAVVILFTLHALKDTTSLLIKALDALLIVAMVMATEHYFWLVEELESGLYELETVDVMYALAGLLPLAELVRRVVGLPLLIVCLLALFYALFGQHMPNLLAHTGIDVYELTTTVWFSFDGVFGRPVAVVTSTILIFIVFGAMLEIMGVGEVLLKLAFRLTRRLPGGDAHAAVLASGLFGTISGSAVANVVGTGVITIPMIKKRGFSAKFAGAVEAAASSGGQLMPPIMGAVAFIMADVTGIPYLDICLAALIPAIFYYSSLFSFISSEARSLGMKADNTAVIERLTRAEKLKCLSFVIPLLVIIALMVSGFSPALAGFWAVIVGFSLNVIFDPQILRNYQALWMIVVNAARSASTIMVAVAAVGIIIAVMNGTGLGLRFAEAIQTVAEGNLFLSLVLMALGCLVLGMGMPTVPAYLIIILIMGPAVEALGVETIAAHLFVVYYAVLSAVTPPVALATFAAAPIAQANPLSMSVTSLRLALVGFLVPFAFVYQPSMLLINESFELMSLIQGLCTTLLAVFAITQAFNGKGVKKIGLMLAGLCAIVPIAAVQLTASVLIAIYLIMQLIQRRSRALDNTNNNKIGDQHVQ